MIYVEKVIQKNAKKEAEEARKHGAVDLPSAEPVKEKKVWPWVMLAVGAVAVGAYFLFFRKKGGTNEGVSN
jgi:hypothetical protein